MVPRKLIVTLALGALVAAGLVVSPASAVSLPPFAGHMRTMT